MTACVLVNADNTLSLAPETACTATEYMLISSSDYYALQHPFANAQPNWDTVLWAMSAGIVLWCIGLGTGIVVSIMRKAR